MERERATVNHDHHPYREECMSILFAGGEINGMKLGVETRSESLDGLARRFAAFLVSLDTALSASKRDIGCGLMRAKKEVSGDFRTGQKTPYRKRRQIKYL